jgi:hypothetical protein
LRNFLGHRNIIFRVFGELSAAFDRVIFRDRGLTLKIRPVISGDYIKRCGGGEGGNSYKIHAKKPINTWYNGII